MLEDFFSFIMFVLNISLFPPYFSFFWSLKFQKMKFFFFYFLYVFFSIFLFLKIQHTIYVHTHVIFWEFGSHFSNLHINMYHVFDANFE